MAVPRSQLAGIDPDESTEEIASKACERAILPEDDSRVTGNALPRMGRKYRF
jgi:hypothetical protein